MKKFITISLIVLVILAFLAWAPWMTKEFVKRKTPEGYFGENTLVEWFPFGRITLRNPNNHKYVVFFWGGGTDDEVFD